MPDSLELTGEVATIRMSRIAVVTLKHKGATFDLDWPLSMLLPGTEHGDELTITVSRAPTLLERAEAEATAKLEAGE